MFEWILVAPKQIFAEQRQNPVSLGTTILAGLSALFSAALADAVLTSGTVGHLALVFSSSLLSFSFFILLYNQISRLFAEQSPGSGIWFRAGVLVILPMHLLLPAALVCRPLGTGGVVLYAFIQLVIFSLMIRRAQWAAQALLGWPIWASFLLILSPFLIGVVGAVIMACLMAVLVGMVLVASLS